MYIALDPSKGSTLYLLRSGVWEHHHYPVERVGQFLPALISFLKETSLSLEMLDGFGVLVGKGTFTATRVAVTLANILSFSRGVTISVLHELPDPAQAKDVFESAAGRPYIQATYHSEPRIYSAQKKS